MRLRLCSDVVIPHTPENIASIRLYFSKGIYLLLSVRHLHSDFESRKFDFDHQIDRTTNHLRHRTRSLMIFLQNSTERMYLFGFTLTLTEHPHAATHDTGKIDFVSN